MEIQEKKIEFLYKALEDAQQTIRFVDTKTSVTTFIVGLIAALLSSGLTDFSDYFWNFPVHLQIISIILVIYLAFFIILTIHCAIQVVFPKTNPSEHVLKSKALKNLFYLSEISEINGVEVIKPTYDDYLNSIMSLSTGEEIIDELAYEVQKVSYIRESKIAKVKEMKRYLRIALVGLPFILFIHYWGLSKYKTKSVSTKFLNCSCMPR